jgi:hypothetical protein
MAEQSISSLFSDVLGTPNTQAEQLAADRALGEKLQQGGSAALLFAPERARRLTQTIGGIAGADTRSPAEREAQATRKLVSGAMQKAAQQYPNSRAMQLKAVAQQLMSAGKSAEAAKFQDAAQAAELQEAKIQSEQAQTYQRNQAGNASREQAATTEATREGEVNKLAAQITKENALAAQAGSAKRKTEAEIATEILMRNPTISKAEADAAAAKALADQRNAETETTNLMRPLLIEEKEAQITATEKGIEVDDARIKLINEQVDTEEVTRRAAEQQITVDEARKQLLDEEILRYQAMTPIEIIKANTEVAKNTQAARLAKAQLADIGMTDFLRELESTSLSDEEKEELKRKRSEGRAITAGVSGYDPNAAATKAVVDKIVRYSEEGEDASKGLSVAERILKVAPKANTGSLLNFKDAYTWVAANVFGGDEDTQKKIASELMDVVLNDALLEKTSILKGVLSDSDMKILKESIAQRGNRPETIALAFTDFAAKRFAVVRSAEYFDRLLIEQGSNMKIPPFEIKKAIETLAELDYQGVAEAKGIVPVGTYEVDDTKVDKAIALLEKFNITYTPYYK